jgi:acetylornithine deacetylase
MRSMRSRPRACKPTARIHFQSVIEEESTGVGALSTLQRGYRADACFIPEPTSGKMVRSQVGVIWFRLKVRGHSRACVRGRLRLQRDHRGLSSHSRAGKARGRMERARQERSHFKAVTHPINFNPGIIKGGDWASSVPAWCDVDCRIAILPGWSVADCQAEILACVSAAARDHRFLSNNPPDVEWSGFLSEGYELKDSAAPEAAFGKAFERGLWRHGAEDLVFTALTDTRFYGLNYNIPSLCFGASGAAMHGFNEYVDLDSLRKSTKATALFIAEWCGVEKAVGYSWSARGPSVRLALLRSVDGSATQRLHDRIQPVGQRRRARLQDQRRLDLDDAVVAHRRNSSSPAACLIRPARLSCRTTRPGSRRARRARTTSGEMIRSLAAC